MEETNELRTSPLRLTLIRHGRTPGNLAGSFVGSLDQPVAPEGRAELAALMAAGIYPAAEAVFTSPMRRCRETAALLYPGREAVVVDDLRERHFGEFEGRTHAEIIALPGYADWGWTEASMQFPGGEDKDAFFGRCSAAFRALVDRCAADGLRDVAAVLHGGVIMAVMQRFCRPERGYFDWACGNGLGYRVAYDPADHTLALLDKLTPGEVGE